MSISKTVIGSIAFVATLMSALVVSAGSNAEMQGAGSYELPDLKMKLLLLEAGEFEMGSPADETNRQDNEFQHRVRLTKSFFIEITDITQAQYTAVMGKNPSYFQGDDLPVENVSWHDAVRFCTKLSKRQGRTFRLPTEAEWEYAARAGKEGPVSGSGKLDEMAWYADNSGRQRLDSAKLWDADPNIYFQHLLNNGCGTHPVATARPNDWGLYDMQGNVAEWVHDWFSEDYFHDDAAGVDPRGPKKSSLGSRVMRGGSWGSDPRNCRVAHRDWNVPDTQTASCGFRVVMDAE